MPISVLGACVYLRSECFPNNTEMPSIVVYLNNKSVNVRADDKTREWERDRERPKMTVLGRVNWSVINYFMQLNFAKNGKMPTMIFNLEK